MEVLCQVIEPMESFCSKIIYMESFEMVQAAILNLGTELCKKSSFWKLSSETFCATMLHSQDRYMKKNRMLIFEKNIDQTLHWLKTQKR